MNTMTASAAAKRESHRRADGTFGVQPHSEQDELALERVDPDADAREILEQANKSARFFTAYHGAYGRDQADDIAAEAILKYLESEAKRRTDPAGQAQIMERRAYLHTVARRQAANTLANRTNSRDVTALASLNAAVGKAENELERGLTTQEYEALAQQIRAAIPAKNRPSPDFHHSRVPVQPMDQWQGQHDVVDHDDHSEPFEVGSHGHRAFEENDSRTQAGIARAKRSAFLAIAERFDAPAPIESKLSLERASKLRTAREKAGGVMALVRAFEDGRDSGPLFEPFDEALTSTQRQAIADMFTEHPNYADDLWTSAVQIATKYRKAPRG